MIELATGLGMAVIKRDLDFYDAYNADEMFITSTSFCIVPVRSFNGAVIADGELPGPITKRLTDAYIDLVDYDFVGQYLRHLD